MMWFHSCIASFQMARCITKWVTVILGRTWLVVSSQVMKIWSMLLRRQPSSGTLRPISNVTDSSLVHLYSLDLFCTREVRFIHIDLFLVQVSTFVLERVSFPFSLPLFFLLCSTPRCPILEVPNVLFSSLLRSLGSSFWFRICFTILWGHL